MEVIMTLDEFVIKYNGKSIDYDHAYGSQCVDLAKLWEAENGWDIISGNAIDEPKNITSQYVFIKNTPSGIPKAGNLVIWDYKPYGHIAIFISGNSNSFNSFDQNYPIGSACHIQAHGYQNVIGWISHKGDQMSNDSASHILQYEKDASRFHAKKSNVMFVFRKGVHQNLGSQELGADTCNPQDLVKRVEDYATKLEKEKGANEALKQANTSLMAEIERMVKESKIKDIQILELSNELKVCKNTSISWWQKIINIFKKGAK